MKKTAVLIIGGGVAGLMAARQLSHSCEITLLEATPVLGGRIKTIYLPDDQVIEAGAEFIHGHLPLTMQLLKEAGIETVPVEGSMYRKEAGRWKEQDEMIEGWDELLEKMKAVKGDMTMYDFLEKEYSGEKHAALRRHIIAYTEGFDIADIKKVSLKALYKEWNHEEEDNFRIPGGYVRLVNYLHQQCINNGCTIITDSLVKQIDWQQNAVTVNTDDEQKYYAEKIIVTVPLPILNSTAAKASINFTPTIKNYIEATENIGFGAVIKVVLHFAKAFWKEDTGFIFSDEIIPAWWTQLPAKNEIFTGWAGGPKAEQLSCLAEEDILDEALQSLANIYDKPVKEIHNNLLQWNIFNWQQEGTVLGGYNYGMPATPAARALLNTPLLNTVFFAGEALYSGNAPGTVEAALVSGKEVAEKIGRI